MKVAAITFLDKEEKRYQSVMGLFDDCRKRNYKQEDHDLLYRYQLRESDEGTGDLVTVEDHVMVNHGGDFITDTKIEFSLKTPNGNGYANLSDDDPYPDMNYQGEYYPINTKSEYDPKDIEEISDEEVSKVLENERIDRLSELIFTDIKEYDRIGSGEIRDVTLNEDKTISFLGYGKDYVLKIEPKQEEV